MRILFNLIDCGLGPNGGSSTIVNSANALQDLGHEVIIIDSMKNQHPWTPLRCEHLIVKNKTKIPKADVAITTGFNTCKTTLEFPANLKVMWLRGWETWKISEKQIVETLLSLPLFKVVNSIGLQRKLSSYNYDSDIIRPGNTLEEFFPLNNKKDNKDIVLGGLFHTKHMTKRHEWCIKASNILKRKYPSIKLNMFGANNNPNNSDIDLYTKTPTKEEKNNYYNGIDIWLSPSNLEGLHIVPQEAMLTECPIVSTNAPLGGTEDYTIHNKTGLISNNNLDSFIGQIDTLIKDVNLRKQLGKNARKNIIKLGDRKDNMKKMVNLYNRFL